MLLETLSPGSIVSCICFVKVLGYVAIILMCDPNNNDKQSYYAFAVVFFKPGMHAEAGMHLVFRVVHGT